jgi:hypothetical protein
LRRVKSNCSLWMSALDRTQQFLRQEDSAKSGAGIAGWIRVYINNLRIKIEKSLDQFTSKQLRTGSFSLCKEASAARRGRGGFPVDMRFASPLILHYYSRKIHLIFTPY